MTREELEKKRGKKLPKRAASAAESLIVKENEDNKEKTGENGSLSTLEETKSEAVQSTVSGNFITTDGTKEYNPDSLKPKKKKEVMEHLSLRLPKQTLNDLDVVKYVYGDVSKYVRHLIDKDLKENLQTYIEKRAIIKDVINR